MSSDNLNPTTILSSSITRRLVNTDNGDESIFSQTNVAVWVLMSASAMFLFMRLWCRHHFSKWWYDDGVLTITWMILLTAAALISAAISVGYHTDDAKRTFFLYQNISTSLTTIGTAWTKVAFALTLMRIMRNIYLRYVLYFVIVTVNLVLVLGMLSIWIPACTDPRKHLRPQHDLCFDHMNLMYLGGTTMVYGGLIDVLLALFPWFIIHRLLLETREKLGLSFAMSLGFISGMIVILRTFFQFKRIDNNYHYLAFLAIFNFLEPCVNIIAQTTPQLRVLFVNAKHHNSSDIMLRLTSPTAAIDTNKLNLTQLEDGSGRGPSDSPGSPMFQHEELARAVSVDGERKDKGKGGWQGTGEGKTEGKLWSLAV